MSFVACVGQNLAHCAWLLPVGHASDSEASLTAWMSNHLSVTWCEHPAPLDVERGVIECSAPRSTTTTTRRIRTGIAWPKPGRFGVERTRGIDRRLDAPEPKVSALAGGGVSVVHGCSR